MSCKMCFVSVICVMLCFDGEDTCDSQRTHVTTHTRTHMNNKTRVHNIIVTSVGCLHQTRDANIVELPSFIFIVHLMYTSTGNLRSFFFILRGG